MNSQWKHTLGLMIVLTLALAACSGGAATESPTEAPTSEPEVIDPSVSVSDQDATGGTVTIDFIYATDPSWIVIHADNEGGPGAVIGHAAVSVGDNNDVLVEIDLMQATAQLFAMLHLDAGTVGEYEFPGDDAPVRVGDGIVNVAFQVDLPPSVTVSDQDATGGTVTIDFIFATDPSWIVIHADNEGGPGAVIGHAAVSVGDNNDVLVEIDPSQTTPVLFAMLHLDAGIVGEYEFPGDDAPVQVGDGIVNVPFQVDVPSSVTVSDQDAAGGTVTIDFIYATDPSWIVIHADNEGSPGAVIGHAAVAVGDNSEVLVEIDLSMATPVLYAMLHMDAGTVGEYEFPGDDAPVRVGDSIVNVPFNIEM